MIVIDKRESAEELLRAFDPGLREDVQSGFDNLGGNYEAIVFESAKDYEDAVSEDESNSMLPEDGFRVLTTEKATYIIVFQTRGNEGGADYFLPIEEASKVSGEEGDQLRELISFYQSRGS